jgi:hypothetical protein
MRHAEDLPLRETDRLYAQRLYCFRGGHFHSAT